MEEMNIVFDSGKEQEVRNVLHSFGISSFEIKRIGAFENICKFWIDEQHSSEVARVFGLL